MLILTDEQKVALAIDARTAAGNPAKLDGAPVWTSSAPEIVSLQVAEDGLSAVATTVGPVGTSQISVMADADLDEGEFREIVALLDVEVVAAEAATLGISASTPELK